MAPMRVGIDCRKIFDFGIGTYIRGLLGGLAELGSGDDFVAFLPSKARGVVPPPIETAIVDTPNYTIRELFTMRRAIDRARIDLFHSPHIVLPFIRCPSVVTLHDVILFRFPPRNPIGNLYVQTMTRRAIRKSVTVLTVTEAAKRDLVSVLRCDSGKIVVAPNGVTPLASVAPASGRYFLFVGNDKPHKNVDRLVESFKRLRQRDASVDLVLAGGAFARFATVDGVRTEGFVSDDRLAALYRGALALLIPSLDEGFGLPALEAMSCATPVVTSTAPALVEVTDDAALHVDALSIESIASAMSRLAGDDALRRDLGQRGTMRSLEFTWRRSAELTLRAYRSALS